MHIIPFKDGWNRVDGLDVEIQHGVPVRLSRKKNDIADNPVQHDRQNIADKVFELTGFSISARDWIDIDESEQESVICINRDEFKEVLRRLALSSGAMFVERFHKAIDENAVDWDLSEFNYDFNHASEHCCIPYDSLDRKDYFNDYIQTMHDESVRLIDEGVSPLVEAE